MATENATKTREVVSAVIEIETDQFVVPSDFQQDALKEFDAKYKARKPERVRVTGMQHVVGQCVRYTIEATMLVDPGPEPVAGAQKLPATPDGDKSK